MTILWADSFDHYGDDESNMLDGPYSEVVGTISTDQARTGARSWSQGNFCTLRRQFGAAKTEVGVGMAVYFNSLPGGNGYTEVISFRANTNFAQVRLCVESTGAIGAYAREDNDIHGATIHLGTSTGLLAANSWNHIEAFIAVDSTDGAVEVRLNGVTIMNLTGINTDINGTGEVSQYASFMSRNIGTSGSYFIDDVIAWDTAGSVNNDFIGDKKVFTDFPNADTAVADWTPSSGSSLFAMVDQTAPDDDTTYDSASSSGEAMELGYPAVDASVVTVAAVILVSRARKTDAGTCTLLQGTVSSGSTAEGVDHPITTQYTYYEDAIEVDPHTSAPWLPAAVSAAKHKIARSA